jgi:peptidoglycan/xylan/chitin deacetylase (PgdA/CDA1 family)
MTLELIRAAKVPVTFFLTTNYVAGNQAWFTALRDTGYVTIHNHTVSHPNLRSGGYGVAHDQLCRANDNLTAWFGQRPTLFRPPFGEYDASTLQAAWSCGLQAGLHWRETVDQGMVNYQRDHGRIHAGDIILMHFRPAFPDDFLAALQAIKNSGLVPARLEDYVRVGAGMPLPTTPPTTTDPPTTTTTTTDPPTTAPTTTDTTTTGPPPAA